MVLGTFLNMLAAERGGWKPFSPAFLGHVGVLCGAPYSQLALWCMLWVKLSFRFRICFPTMTTFFFAPTSCLLKWAPRPSEQRAFGSYCCCRIADEMTGYSAIKSYLSVEPLPQCAVSRCPEWIISQGISGWKHYFLDDFSSSKNIKPVNLTRTPRTGWERDADEHQRLHEYVSAFFCEPSLKLEKINFTLILICFASTTSDTHTK